MTTGTVRQLRKRPAKRPARRTVEIVLTGDYEGWEATAKADFPSRLIAELQSGQIERIIGALDAIITDHNFPNDDDELAASMGDVDYTALGLVAAELTIAIGKLPNR